MKMMILAVTFASSMVFANEPPPTTTPPAQPVKVTVKDAKKACKDEGKQGADLLKCIKEKKGTE